MEVDNKVSKLSNFFLNKIMLILRWSNFLITGILLVKILRNLVLTKFERLVLSSFWDRSLDSPHNWVYQFHCHHNHNLDHSLGSLVLQHYHNYHDRDSHRYICQNGHSQSHCLHTHVPHMDSDHNIDCHNDSGNNTDHHNDSDHNIDHKSDDTLDQVQCNLDMSPYYCFYHISLWT